MGHLFWGKGDASRSGPGTSGARDERGDGSGGFGLTKGKGNSWCTKAHGNLHDKRGPDGRVPVLFKEGLKVLRPNPFGQDTSERTEGEECPLDLPRKGTTR